MQEVREQDEAAARKAEEKEKELEHMRQDHQRLWDNMTHMLDMIDSLLKQMRRGQGNQQQT